MLATAESARHEYLWEVHPAAAQWVIATVTELADRNPAVRRLADVLRGSTGTRLVDWLDHIALASAAYPNVKEQLAEVGYTEDSRNTHVWRHPLGMFPAIVLDVARAGLAMRCESIEAASSLLPKALGQNIVNTVTVGTVPVSGQPGAPYRCISIGAHNGIELWLVERHGYAGFENQTVEPGRIEAASRHAERFRRRQRAFDQLRDGFAHATQLFTAAANDLGTAWACDLFFAAEREYWQSRNHAARIQFERQQRLGLGWANHDHHTYRSSRAAFRHLISVLEQMGFICRERFYAGREAGWGAQVLEQPDCRVVIFADVDLSPEEVAGDFAHETLPEREQLGTVGLWCELHGEAFLEAGMHHLECQFDFDAAREQLAELGVETMAPFTDFPFLKQAFTKGEMWPVDPRRIERLASQGRISTEQAERFRRDGALGSHLEILERNDGYKGFNQTGISEIITRTDPRRTVGA
jgi:hypothetical protein